jgi:8-oxo-dGTP diphosphatase
VPPIEIVAALIRDAAGRILLVRKRGTRAFMQPGGKRNAGEDDRTALARELGEELGCSLVAGSVRRLGEFVCAAANEPGREVKAAVYAVDVTGVIRPAAEIVEVAWLDPARPDVQPLAPLTRDHILPLANLNR